jgi:hypothetical protein
MHMHRQGHHLWVRVPCSKIDAPADQPQLFVSVIENSKTGMLPVIMLVDKLVKKE